MKRYIITTTHEMARDTAALLQTILKEQAVRIYLVTQGDSVTARAALANRFRGEENDAFFVAEAEAIGVPALGRLSLGDVDTLHVLDKSAIDRQALSRAMNRATIDGKPWPE